MLSRVEETGDERGEEERGESSANKERDGVDIYRENKTVGFPRGASESGGSEA